MKNLSLIVLLYLVFPFVSFAQDISQVSTIKGSKHSSAIVIDKNNILHLVFNNVVKRKKAQIFYQQSTDNGLTYSKEVVVSPENLESVVPDITIDTNGCIYVAWSTIVGSGSTMERQVLLSKSIDQGKTFLPPTVAFRSSQVARLVSADAPTVVVDKNNILFVIISNGSAIDSEKGIFITSSKDQGDTFSTPILISNMGEFTSKASVVFDSQNNMYIFYYGDGVQDSSVIYLISSMDRINFNNPQVLTRTTRFNFNGLRATIDKNDNIYASFDTGNSIGFVKSMDKGKTFTAPVTVADSIGMSPAIVVDELGKIIIAWEEGIDLRDKVEIFISSSTTNGVSFESKSKLSTNAIVSFGVIGVGNNKGDAFFSWISIVNSKNYRSSIFTKNVNR